MSKPYQDRETLLEAYNDLRTQEKVAEHFGVSETTIREWMKRNNISAPRNESKPYHQKEKLRKAYNKHKTIESVAEHFGVATTTIGNWLRKYDLNSSRWEQPTKRKVEEIYNKLGGQEKVANHFDVHISTVVRWMDWYNIDVEYETLAFTPERPYRGGWEKIANKIRERDGSCRNCGVNPEQTLQVHHIVPVREFKTHKLAHDANNLVSLCPSCHGKLERMPEQKQRELIQ